MSFLYKPGLLVLQATLCPTHLRESPPTGELFAKSEKYVHKTTYVIITVSPPFFFFSRTYVGGSPKSPQCLVRHVSIAMYIKCTYVRAYDPNGSLYRGVPLYEEEDFYTALYTPLELAFSLILVFWLFAMTFCKRFM